MGANASENRLHKHIEYSWTLTRQESDRRATGRLVRAQRIAVLGAKTLKSTQEGDSKRVSEAKREIWSWEQDCEPRLRRSWITEVSRLLETNWRQQTPSQSHAAYKSLHSSQQNLSHVLQRTSLLKYETEVLTVHDGASSTRGYNIHVQYGVTNFKDNNAMWYCWNRNFLAFFVNEGKLNP